MRTAYSREEMNGVRQTRRRSGRRSKERDMELASREKQRFVQLLVCVILFAVALVGKNVFPQKTECFKAGMLTVLQSDTDFKTAFIGVGKAVTDGQPVLETLGDLWIEVFGGSAMTTENSVPDTQDPLCQQERALLTSGISVQDLLRERLGLEAQEKQARKEEDAANETANAEVKETAGWEERQDASQPAVLSEQTRQLSSGSELPVNCTMELYQLGLKETLTPVLGILTSGFGYRNDPFNGEIEFHYGVDIAADTGTPIYAFASGVVDYIGESEIYGKYIQLRHDNEITTFYAHCSKLCVQKGKKVSMGDIIARVGETGKTTGPHLHFEIKLNGVFLNPLNYIDTL